MHAVYDTPPPEPCPTPFNLATYVLEAGRSMPDKVALVVLGPTRAERWSFGRLRAAILGSATGLLAAGLAPGDRVLMRLGNTVDFPILYLGAIAAGLVPVPTSAQLTAPEVARLMTGLHARAILRAKDVATPETDLPVFDLEDCRAWRALPAATPHMGDPERLAYIVFTSGTSGRPRAVAHAHRAIWARRMMHDGWYGLTAQDRLLHAGAFNWTFTLGTGLLDPWSKGATALIAAPGTQVAQLPLLMKRADATLFAAAPGVFRALLNSDLPKMPNLRHALSAGEKLSDRLRRNWRDATGTEIYEAFGMSEISTFISSAPGQTALGASLGKPQHGRRVAILGEDGAPVPVNTPGDIAVSARDPGLMLGYLSEDDAMPTSLEGDWFRTGDRGSMSDSGEILYHGRADDILTAGGFRVSPLEVEAALSDIPGLSEIAVTQVELKADAHVIAAVYTGPVPLDSDTLERAAAARLARYKQPRLWQHVTCLPRNANGKLMRKALPELLHLPT